MSTVLITGGHKGLGLEAARRISATPGHDFLLAGRNLAEVEAAATNMRGTFGVNARAILLDVSSLVSVRAAAVEVRRLVAVGEVAPLQVLMLNAGAQFLGPVGYSADGYERTFATNCLGHFLLVNLLLDGMERGGRVVWTASGTHDPATMDGRLTGRAAAPDAVALAGQGKQGRALPGGVLYATSKLCTILYAYELDRRLRAAGAGVASVAFDPGLIVETGLTRSAPVVAQRLMRTKPVKGLFRTLGVTMGSIPFSGGALAEVATGPRFAGASGTYVQSKNGRLIEARSSKASYDQDAARQLWADSEALAHLRPEEQPAILAGSGATTMVTAMVSAEQASRDAA